MSDSDVVTVVETEPESSPLTAAIETQRGEAAASDDTTPGDEQPETSEAAELETQPEAEVDEGDDATVEEEPEEAEAEASAEEEPALVEVALPEHFKETQGREMIEVAPEDEHVLKSLVNAFEHRAEREIKESALRSEEQDLFREVEDFRLQVHANPFGVLDHMLGDDAEMVYRAHLLSNPTRFQEHVDWMVENTNSEETLKIEKDRAEVTLQKRSLEAQRMLGQRKVDRETAAELHNTMRAVLDRIAPEHREFVGPRMSEEIREAVQADQQRTGKVTVEPAVIAEAARPWVERYGAETGESPPETGTEEEVEGTSAETARRVAAFKTKQTKAKSARTVPASGGPTSAPRSPKRGTTLDDVIKQARSGKISVLG